MKVDRLDRFETVDVFEVVARLEMATDEHRIPIIMEGDWQAQVIFKLSKTGFFFHQWPLLELRESANGTYEPVLADLQRLAQVLDEHFVFYQPRYTVSES